MSVVALRYEVDLLIYYHRVPPNVRFLVDDVEDEWTYDTPFDYIHCRYLAGAIADWPKLIRKAYQLSDTPHLRHPRMS